MATLKTIEFLDDVLVTRPDGETDEYGIPVGGEVIYQGKCNYQEGRVNKYNTIVRTPTVYLPGLVIVDINDQVEVTTHLGRTIKGLVDVPRDIEMPLHKDIKLVELELKLAQ